MPYKDPEQRREYQRQWIANRRADYFSGKSCIKCGSTDRLELDHVDPTKKITHHIWSWSKSRRDGELAKCQVLCYDHHRQKSVTECASGEAHGHSKLTVVQVEEIRELYRSGLSSATIAAKMKISPPTVRDIVALRTWRNSRT